MNLISFSSTNSNPVGIGLRAQHYNEIINSQPNIGWFEIHSENYFGKGGKPHHYLTKIAEQYPISCHGVGLSLGSVDEINVQHLDKLKKLIQQINPIFISEHLCWSSVSGQHFNDLLPLPLTDESLSHLIQRINFTQEYLNRQILIENISTYLQFQHSTIPEYEFLVELANRTECGILLDINNLYVNSINHGWNLDIYIKNMPAHLVYEIHLAGFTENKFPEGSILIDTHSHPVSSEVWALYKQAILQFGIKPTLIEWDTDIPELNTLLAEAYKAQKIMENIHALSV